MKLWDAINSTGDLLRAHGASIANSDLVDAFKHLECLGWKIVGPEPSMKMFKALVSEFDTPQTHDQFKMFVVKWIMTFQEDFGRLLAASPSVDELLAEGEKTK